MADTYECLAGRITDNAEQVLETTVGGVLRDAAERTPGTLALVEGVPDGLPRRHWTFSDLLSDAERVARALLSRFEVGERVAVWSPNSPEWVLLEFGAALAGLTLVTVNPAFKASEARHVLRQSRAQGILFAPSYRGRDLAQDLSQIRDDLPGLRVAVSFADWDELLRSGSPTQRLPRVQGGDPAEIHYTSGTTGFPKGAVLRHRGITNNARFSAEILEAEPGDVWVNPMPLFHTAGCVMMTLGSVQRSVTQVLPPGFDPGLVLQLIDSERGTLFGGVPTMLLAMLQHPDFGGRNLSSVRVAMSGGAPVPATLVRRVESTLDVPVSIAFAQTEASPIVTQTRLGDSPTERAETVGRPHPHVEVRIADPLTGETTARGEVGEIVTRGYHVMEGYFDDPRATAKAIDAGGWLHTGDLGSMDECGFCRVLGRVKDMIIRGGENIYPREIEDLLLTHPGVEDVAVVGVPDEHWGEQVAAFVKVAPGRAATEDELFAYCRARLAPYKAPSHWVFTDGFPLTMSGKVRKFALREQFASRQLGHSA